jgi:hypothetical protein
MMITEQESDLFSQDRRQNVLCAEEHLSASVEKFMLGIGNIIMTENVTHGKNMKQNGIVDGKQSFLKSGKK